ncbi:MAG: hypothetical protein EB084_13410 [Proteobacteria bacterium]|nr:hypothetical protein [Pseudomonadota bacterium]
MNARILALLALLLVALNGAVFLLQHRERKAARVAVPAEAPATVQYEGFYVAWSADGATWTPPQAMPLMTGETGHHPRLAWISGRPFIVYDTPYQGMARSEVGRTGVGHGFHLEVSVPVTVSGEEGKASHPCVMQIPSGDYRLYYVASGEVRSALSRDGITWKREPGTRLEGPAVDDADVIMFADGRYRLFHTRQGAPEVRSAVSTDGLRFTVDEGSRVEGTAPSTMFLMSSGAYQMLFQTVDASIGSALSRDGLSFQVDPAFRGLFPPTATLQPISPSVTIHTDGTWVAVCAYEPRSSATARSTP